MTIDQAREAVDAAAVELSSLANHGTSLDLRTAQSHLKTAMDQFAKAVRDDEVKRMHDLAERTGDFAGVEKQTVASEKIAVLGTIGEFGAAMARGQHDLAHALALTIDAQLDGLVCAAQAGCGHA